MSIPAVLFSYRGRISTKEFWLKGVLPWCGIFLIWVIAMLINKTPVEVPIIATVTVTLTGFVLMIYTGFAVLVKRCHDVGKSSWLSLIALIPIANYVFIVWLGLASSEASDNKHGTILG